VRHQQSHISEKAMRPEHGFTLIEVLVVIAIIGILLSLATLDFSTWQKKYAIEAQTRGMLTDFTDARLQAIHRKNFVTITLSTNSYVITRFGTETLTNGTTIMTKQLKYPIQQFAPGNGTLTDFSNTVLTIDERGYIGSTDYLTIAVAPSQTSASLNCLSVQAAQTNAGKINGTKCELK